MAIGEYVIDCDALPLVPKYFKIEIHQKGGQFKWDWRRVELYSSKSIFTRDLVAELAGKTVLNASVLDYLLAYPHLIPRRWRRTVQQFEKQEDPMYLKIVFLGTTYRFSSGDLCVPCLSWHWGHWDQDMVSFDDRSVWDDGFVFILKKD